MFRRIKGKKERLKHIKVVNWQTVITWKKGQSLNFLEQYVCNMSLRVSYFWLLPRCVFLYGWAFFISNIVLLMMLLVIDEEENQFISRMAPSQKRTKFLMPSTNTNPKFLFVGTDLFTLFDSISQYPNCQIGCTGLYAWQSGCNNRSWSVFGRIHSL